MSWRQEYQLEILCVNDKRKLKTKDLIGLLEWAMKV